MKLRCMQWDFAVLDGCKVPENNGRVVRIQGYLGKIEGLRGRHRWQIDATLTTDKGEEIQSAQDQNLTPLRGTAEEVIAQLVAMKLGSPP